MKSKSSSKGILKNGIHSVSTYIKNIKSWIQDRPSYQTVQRKIGHKMLSLLIKIGVLIFLILILRSCVFSGSNKHDSKHPTSVVVAKVRKGDIPLYEKTIGTVTPINSVTVRTQINGRITKVLFKEGQLVKKGDLLVQIDPQPYEALVKQYEGQLLKDQAFLDNARLDLKRYRTLYKEDSVSQQTLDTQIYLVKQYEGIVKSDEGQLDTAKVNLKYCKIMADIEGVVGLQYVNPGNFVQTSDTTPISTINSITPTTVIFPIPEDNLPTIQENFRSKGKLDVDAFDKKGDTLIESGDLTAIDSQIDSTTGTIKLRATFKNEKFLLFPNQFVNIRLKVDTLKDSLIIPTAAIQMGSKGNYVYVVNEKTKTVSAKVVTVKTTVGEDAAITGDLQEGQSIVTQGQDKLTEGSLIALAKTQPEKATKGHNST